MVVEDYLPCFPSFFFSFPSNFLGSFFFFFLVLKYFFFPRNRERRMLRYTWKELGWYSTIGLLFLFRFLRIWRKMALYSHSLLEQISFKDLPRYNKNPSQQYHYLNNHTIALKFLRNEGIRLIGIGPEGKRLHNTTQHHIYSTTTLHPTPHTITTWYNKHNTTPHNTTLHNTWQQNSTQHTTTHHDRDNKETTLSDI